MKIEKRKGQKVRFEIDRRFYIGVKTGVVNKVFRRENFCKVQIISDNAPDEGKRADYVDEDQIIAYYDENTEQWTDL